MARAERWIVDRQEADGSWGGIQPPWVYSLIALHLRGYPLDHPVMQRGLEGLDTFTIDERRESRRLEACQCPVWDTALAMIALADAGVPARRRGARPRRPTGCSAKQVLHARRLGGPPARRRRPAAGRSSSRTPTTPTSTTRPRWCSRCSAVDHPDPERLERAIDRGVAWLEGMQSSDGGWGAFDADNCRSLVRDLPFCDFGEVIDPPSADVTAHVIEMLAAVGRAGAQPRAGGHRLAAARLRSRTARGSGAGGSTTSTAPAPPSRR